MQLFDQTIRVRVAIRADGLSSTDTRETFWKSIRSSTDAFDEDLDDSKCEAKVIREVPEHLKEGLAAYVRQEIDGLVSSLAPDRDRSYRDLSDIISTLERTLDDRRSRRDFDLDGVSRREAAAEFARTAPSTAEALARATEYRARHSESVLRALLNYPSYGEALARMAAAERVLVSVAIVGYSSLQFEIAAFPLDSLAKAFGSDFQLFQLFLDIFVPKAFEETFDLDGVPLNYQISVGAGISRAFANSPQAQPSAGAVHAAAYPVSDLRPVISPEQSSRQRADWIWRLANGSLLAPVVLLLLVLAFSVQTVLETRNVQSDALKVILEHYHSALSTKNSTAVAPASAEDMKPMPRPADSTTSGAH